MLNSTIAFGDTVRIVSAPETERLGIAGKSGPVYGETTPTVSGVEVVGILTRDFALNVYLEELKESFWLPEHLVELVDHGEGTTFTVDGISKRWVRTAEGGWDETDVQ
jgi:hypothetical protein